MRLPKIFNKTVSLRLSLMMVFEIALLLLASLAVIFAFSRKAMKDEAMREAEQTLEGTVQQIDNVLLSIEQATGNVYVDMMRHLNEPERMFDYSNMLVECNPYIVGCAIVFKPNYYPGHELYMAYVHRKGSSLTTDEHSELITQDTFTNKPYTEQIWYTEPMEKKRACWVGPLKNEETEDDALITFCIPIYDRSQTCVGVVAVDLAIGVLSKIVLEAKPSQNGYSTLLAANGSFIVHPDEDKLLHQTVFTQIEEDTDPSVREVSEAMVRGESGFEAFVLEGKKYYTLFQPFKRLEVPNRSMEPLEWSIGVVYPDDDLFGDYNRLLNIVVTIAIGGLLLFLVFCYLITRFRLAPLRMLTLSAQRIADGNYNETIPDTRRVDEIGQLQEHFQQMQLSLAANIGKLQKLTATLKARGEELNNAYNKAKEADHMKTAFLHHMTNQMLEPSDAIIQSAVNFCDHYNDISQQEADCEMEKIQKQSQFIIDLLSQMIHDAESETGKEDSHE